MARIIIASASTGRQLEVEQAQFDDGFFKGWVYVADAPLAATTEPSVEETRVAAMVSAGGSGPLPTALRAAYVPKWKPSTAYTSGDFVLNPSGQIVSANATFTSGATYSAANWTVVSGGGAVASVNGHTGTVSLAAADVNADPAGAAAGMALIFGA